MDQHDIWFELGKYMFQALKNGSGDIRQILAGLHGVEIKFRLYTEQAEYLIEHFAVLACNAYLGLEPIICRQCQDKWGHFDGFRTSAKYTKSSHSCSLIAVIEL
ncbi:hypothetical protein D3C76_1388690 [compost metagenome]